MSKYNKKTFTKKVITNKQGGTGLKHEPKMELISLLVTGMTSSFYEKENERETRLGSLIKQLAKKDLTFVAKALIYTRSVVGQRSVTHVGAAQLAPYLSGNALGKRFYSKRIRNGNSGGIVHRIDDMLEIAAYYFMRNPNKPLPNAIKKGFADAITTASRYELAKYQGKNKSVSLVDIFNLVHPKAVDEAQEATFNSLMDGTLKQFNTAEDKNSKAGKDVSAKVRAGTITKKEAVKELAQTKSDNWETLIMNGTIGYMALIRNMKNIVTQSTQNTFNAALKLLVNEEMIRKSLIFPHQIDIAYMFMLESDTIKESNKLRELLTAIGIAYELAIPNLTELFPTGRTAIIVDTSASMQGGLVGSYFPNTKFNGKTSNINPIEKASLIGATLVKGINADLYQFATNCRPIAFNPMDTVNTIKQAIIRNIGVVGHGTNFNSIFTKLIDKRYDRVFVISDNQGADTLLGSSSYLSYVKKHGQPYIYSIDLVGLGSTMFKQNHKLINLFGYSSDIYEMIKTAEINPKAILKEIEKIRI